MVLFKGSKQGSTWRILVAFALIGLAFNMKMLQAYMILPAFYLFYLLAFNAKWRRKIILLIGSTAVLAVVSLSWAVTVDSIPTDERPYIGSSETNSVLELAFGYNGLSRLTGQQNRSANAGIPNVSDEGNVRGNSNSQGSGTDQSGSGSAPTGNLPGNGEMGGMNGMTFPGGQMPNGGEMPNGRNFGGGNGGGGMGGMFGTGEKVLCGYSKLNCPVRPVGFCRLYCLAASPFLQD